MGRAVIAPEPGGPEALVFVDRPAPKPEPGELLVRVAATAVNRADLLQRQGFYPPPPGAPDVLGLELAGEVAALGRGVEGWSVGDRVCAVVAGGGYAEEAIVPAAVAMPLPPGLGDVSAAAVPEVFTTAWDNLVNRGRLEPGETVLVHGGAGGVGTAAIQLAKRRGCVVLATGGSDEKLQACRDLGADAAISYRDDDFVARAREPTGGRGVDVILDVMGASYLARNLDALALEGRLVVIGLQGGVMGELNLALLMGKRLTALGSTLRARTVEERAPLARQMVAEVWPGFADGSLRPVIDRILPLDQVREAHELLAAAEQLGKGVLRVR
jgi:putative PIG3 family NAD(P)H quinone oxidoreductase